MTIRYISSSKAQTSTRSPSTSRNPSQSPDPETSPAGHPAETRNATNVSLPSLFNCQTAIPSAPTISQLKRHRFRYLKAADAQSVERLLQPTSPHCQQAVTQANPWVRPEFTTPRRKNFLCPHKRKQPLFEKSGAKTFGYAGPGAVSATMPQAQHKKVFLLLFVHKK
jgi:hypothetical protein